MPSSIFPPTSGAFLLAWSAAPCRPWPACMHTPTQLACDIPQTAQASQGSLYLCSRRACMGMQGDPMTDMHWFWMQDYAKGHATTR